jgi:hypothetical protein
VVRRQEFDRLTAANKERYRKNGLKLVRLAGRHAIPIVLALPPQFNGKINNASGFVLQRGSGWFLLTARHVLEEYEKRRLRESMLHWQVGNLPPFSPRPRLVLEDKENDIAVLRLTAEEADRLRNKCSFSVPVEWPPDLPANGNPVVLAGYPGNLRELSAARTRIELAPHSALLRAENVHDGHFYCQIEQEELISFNGEPLPKPKTFLGGLSGGPVLLVDHATCPVIGIIVESQDELGLVRIATLRCIDAKMFEGPQ